MPTDPKLLDPEFFGKQFALACVESDRDRIVFRFTNKDGFPIYGSEEIVITYVRRHLVPDDKRTLFPDFAMANP